MVNRKGSILTNERGTRKFDGCQLDFKLIERQERLQKVLEQRRAAITDASAATPMTSGSTSAVTEATTTTPTTPVAVPDTKKSKKLNPANHN
jgi:hypothetical protein